MVSLWFWFVFPEWLTMLIIFSCAFIFFGEIAKSFGHFLIGLAFLEL